MPAYVQESEGEDLVLVIFLAATIFLVRYVTPAKGTLSTLYTHTHTHIHTHTQLYARNMSF